VTGQTEAVISDFKPCMKTEDAPTHMIDWFVRILAVLCLLSQAGWEGEYAE
jgi:hypothetical protein